MAGAADFLLPRPGRVWQFPQDHGSHPAFKNEWWYYSGHLTTMTGESFGYQLTFFRVALRKPDRQARSAWSPHTVYFAHLALTHPRGRTFLFREKLGRGSLGLDGAEEGRLSVWVGNWRAEARGEEHHLEVKDEEVSLKLALTPLKPPVLHGEGGYSRKAAAYEAASHYYSISRLATTGELTLGGRTLAVTGSSWLDREFSTSPLAPGLVGWDWFALQLADGWEVMLYLLRDRDGHRDAASSGTLISPQGQGHHLKVGDFQVRATGSWKSPHSQATYPAGWEIVIPQVGYRLNLRPTLPDQELRTGVGKRLAYWEGQVEVRGEKGAEPLDGKGYVELTGYAGPMGDWFK